MRRVGWVILLWLAALTQAVAEPRIALVVGNSAYASVSGLPNPVADATLMADALTAVGFAVTLVPDGDLARMRAAVTEFGSALRDAGPEATGLFYYAGHGVQSFGRNYLLPVDAKLSNAADLGLVAIEAESVLRQMFSARNRTNIVILDACRNNPFQNVLDLGDNGLAEMSAPTGTFLAYATAPGSVALDGADGNSPFTAALAAQIRVAGQPIEQVFKNVRVAVLERSGGTQTPWDTSSLTADFSFVPAAALADDGGEDLLWEGVRASRDPVQIMLFLRAYPGGAHDAEARGLLADVMAGEVAGTAPAVPPAPVAAEPAEVAAFGQAQALGTLEAYRAFVLAFPASPFSEAANAEIAALEAAVAPAAPAPAAPAPVAAEVPDDGDMAARIEAEAVRFDAPLATGAPEIVGQSLAQLIQTSPLFAPIEGLPEAAWKGQKCAACHQWTKANLCDQANVYVAQAEERSLSKEHPLGGTFKLTLRAWAKGGCQ